MEPYIITHSGIEFDLSNPSPELVKIEDIAHALSQLCRFTGHTSCFYSVAAHSIQVSNLVPPEHALEALLHDAAEAYVGDVSSPLKAMLPEYRMIEFKVDQAIRQRFGLPAKLTPCIKQADLRRLATEKWHLMPECGPWDILNGIERAPTWCMTLGDHDFHKRQFLTHFHSLQAKALT